MRRRSTGDKRRVYAKRAPFNDLGAASVIVSRLLSPGESTVTPAVSALTRTCLSDG